MLYFFYGDDMKKGFTLVELMAVILIIAILAISSGVAIFSIINDSRNKLLEEQKKGVLDSAITYFVKSKRYMSSCTSNGQEDSVTSSCTGTGALTCGCKVTISTLVSDALFENKNDICKESGEIIVYKTSGELKAKFKTDNACAYE